MSLKRISIAVLATFVLSIPLSAVAYNQKDDEANLRKKKEELKDAQKTLSGYKKECEELTRSHNPQDFGKYLSGASINCYDGCKPLSVGGQCPDALFTQLHAVPNLPADVVAGGKINSNNFVTEVLPGYMANDNEQGKTLCNAVQQQIKMADEFKIDTDQCQQAIASCPFNAKQARLKELAGDGTCSNPDEGDIATEEDQVKNLQSDIDALNDRIQNGCPDCGQSYYQDQSQPTGVEKFAMIMGALEPYVGMGLGTYMYDHSLNQYYSSYGNYLNQCSQIGIPCNGPEAVGGGMGIAAALMPGYIGGLNSGLMSGMMMGGMGMMSPMMMGGMTGMSMMSPMMMGGMGMMSGMYGSIVSAGLMGSMGMMTGMYGMMSPMMMSPMMMSPMMMSPMGMYGSIVSAGLMGSMGMMTGMYGMMSPMMMSPMMGMYGMMSPMGMYGTMSGMYGSIVSMGLMGSMGMMTGMYGMMSPMMMSPSMGMYGMMSPMGMYGSIMSAGLMGSMGMMTGMYGMMSPTMGMYGMMSPTMGMYGMMSPTMGMYGMMSPTMGMYGMMSPTMGMYGTMGTIGAAGYAIGYPGVGGIGTIGAYSGYAGAGYIGTIGAIGSYPGGAVGTIGSYPGGTIGSIYSSPYGYSPYGTSPYGYSSPYGGSQYSALYLASGESAMQSALSSQNGQNLMMSQQNLYGAQLRYYQTAQQAGATGYNGYSPYMMSGMYY